MMYLTKALKAKKKLVNRVQREFEKLEKYNSVEANSTPTYDPKESHASWLKKSKELVELKTKIIQATAPIYGKIFEMNECKSQITNLKNLNVKTGKVKHHYQDSVTEYVAHIDELARDKAIEDLEERIDVLQSEIEAFNSTTKI